MSNHSFQTSPGSHELTPWLSGEEQPLREGVYRRQFPAGPYSCWGGDRWLQDANTPQAAAAQLSMSPHQRTAWRGLTEASGLPCASCRGHGVIDRGVDPESGRDLITECPDCRASHRAFGERAGAR